MLKTRKEIKSWLDKYHITNYTINDDLSVDTKGTVDLYNRLLIEIPIQFNKVYGCFDFSNNYLTSLEGSPKEVNGSFYCYSNKLTSLVGAPEKVFGGFSCHSNKLTSLVGASKEVHGNFYCSYNKLKSLEYLPEVHGELVCDEYLEDTREYKIWLIHHKLKEMV